MQTDQVKQHVLSKLDAMAMRMSLPHAQAFVSQYSGVSRDIARHIAQLLLCSGEGKPCSQCKGCKLLAANQHPDLCWIKSEKEGSAIKIDQIRDLQRIAYTSPQLASAKLIVIQNAEELNQSAANALLKILEEPPGGVYFVLLIANLSSIPLTILSRCQIHHLPAPEARTNNYLDLPPWLEEAEQTRALFQQKEQVLNDVLSFVNGQETLFAVSKRWSSYEFKALMLFLYRMHAQLLFIHYVDASNSADSVLSLLAQKIKPQQLLEQMNRFNGIFKKLHHNVNINPQLCLENCLLNLII